MPDTRMISNPAGVWGQANQADQVILMFTNTSGATRTSGDVVLIDTTAGNIPLSGVTTTTGGGNVNAIGVVSGSGDFNTFLQTFPAGAPMPVCVYGVARVNIGAIAFVAGDFVTAGATAGVAGRTAAAGLVAATIGFSIGIALEAAAAKDAQNTIRCFMKPS